MNHREALAGPLAAVLLGLALFAPSRNASADVKPLQEFTQKATWKIPTFVEVREQAAAWLADREVDDATRAQIETLWTSAVANGGEQHVFDLLVATFAAADPQACDLATTCSRPRTKIALPDVAWLADEKAPAIERQNLRLLYGRWLIQELLFDEASEQIAPLKPEDVVDPAGLLFYQAVIYHNTLQRDPGLKTIAKLLENSSTIPKRHASVARLMQADLEVLKDESLDHIARRMDDIRRRLDLGRAGPKVRGVEDGVIASLDKLIEEMEKQQQAAAAAAAKAGNRPNNIRNTQPMPDSMPAGGKGAGDVAKKPIGDSSGWGDLPPRERQQALQQIGKDYPAHYRDVIEQYFRKLASEGSEKPEK